VSQIATRRINHTQILRTVNVNVRLKVKVSLNLGGGPYCLAADSWNGCTAGPTGTGWTLAAGSNQLLITGHHYNSATFAETKCKIAMY
jgi:hypothetical protein